MNKKIRKSFLIIFGILFSTVSTASAIDSQISKASIVVKLQQVQPQNETTMLLSIALSFTVPHEKPSYKGVRIVTDSLPFDRKKTIFGFRNGDGITHAKLPTQDMILENETYTYVLADADRQENGMFSLYPQRSDPISYLLRGVFYAQGHIFVLDEFVHINEEKICYEQ